MIRYMVTEPHIDKEAAFSITKALARFEADHDGGTSLKKQFEEIESKSGKETPGVYAYAGDTLIGGLTFLVHNDWVFFQCGFVAEGCRNGGVYTRIIDAVEKWAREHGISGLFTSTFDFEAPSLYEKLGFVRGGTMQNCPKGNTSYEYIKDFLQQEEVREPIGYDEGIAEMGYLLSVIKKEPDSVKAANRIALIAQALAEQKRVGYDSVALPHLLTKEKS